MTRWPPEALWQSGSRALGDGNQLEAAADFMALADAFPASEFAPRRSMRWVWARWSTSFTARQARR
jgi:outer membrane protein assembly factor BamD (BamD/ComL family)